MKKWIDVCRTFLVKLLVGNMRQAKGLLLGRFWLAAVGVTKLHIAS